MAPAARTELDSGATCRTCGRALPPGSAVCPGCGAAHGEANQCPHCHAVADVAPHPTLGFRCLVCGGPRVALDVQNVSPSARTRAALESAGREQTKHLMFQAGGLVLSGMGLLALLIATVVVLSTGPNALLTIAAFGAGCVPLIAGLFALARAAGARKLRGQAVHAAQVSALGDVQAVLGLLDAARVSQVMRIPPEQAELLLAEASVATYLNEGPAPRVRVDGSTSGTVLGDSAELEETAATEHGRTTRGDTEI